MVYVEEDPDVGASIKHILDTNVLFHVHDLITLEIWAQCPKEPENLMVVEAWQFCLDTSERLDDYAAAFGLGNSLSKTSTKDEMTGVDYSSLQSSSSNHSMEFAVDEFRHLRLFEKLGTLLKSIMVLTRLLPGYQLLRHQDPREYQMCYTVRRGFSDLTKLGSSPKSYQVGRVFSGLAVAPSAPLGSDNPPIQVDPSQLTENGLDPVYLCATVYHRTQMQHSAADVLGKVNLLNRNRCMKLQETLNPDGYYGSDFHPVRRSSNQNKKHSKHIRSAKLHLDDAAGHEHSKVPCRAKPAFATNQYEMANEDLFDPASQLLGKKAADWVARCFENNGESHLQEGHLDEFDNDDDDEDDDEFDEASDELDAPGSGDHGNYSCVHADERRRLCAMIRDMQSQCINSLACPNTELDDGEEQAPDGFLSSTAMAFNNNNNEEDENENPSPLQLPFSTVGVSGARLTRMFAELRERTNLDLFQVPPANNSATSVISSSIHPGNSDGGGIETASSNNVQLSSLFDADALADELERHERTLKEFDDFLADFQNIELFGLVPSPVKDCRQQQQPLC